MLIKEIKNQKLAKILYEIQQYLLTNEGSMEAEICDIIIAKKNDDYVYFLPPKRDREKNIEQYKNDLNVLYIELPTTWYEGFNVYEYVSQLVVSMMLSSIHWNMSALGAKGGKRSLVTMSIEERRERARKAAQKRWNK